MSDSTDENDQIRARYARRADLPRERYSWQTPYVLYSSQEVDRALMRLLTRVCPTGFDQCRLLEIGCGSGGNLSKLLYWGFSKENISGIDLLPERIDSARSRLPAEVYLQAGDAAAESSFDSFDIVFQSTVFSSILDEQARQRLADTMWKLTRPGGCVLWFDFVYNNPSNPDVVGIPARTVRQLFPAGEVSGMRTLVAPPIGRALSRWYPAYVAAQSLPFLRTHWIGIIEKR